MALQALRRAALLAAPAALALGWAGVSWLAREEARPPTAPVPVYTGWSFNPYAAGRPLDAVQHNADAARAADQARARVQQVLEHGSLRGSDLDGDWGRWVEGRLQPGLSLRQRFDYLLTALGETTPGDLRHWIEEAVTAEMNAGAARQVLAVWDRYITLQQQRFRTQADPAAPASWQAALAERVQARRQILGDDWAQAFYADEEQTLQAHAQALKTPLGGTPRPAEIDPSTLPTSLLTASASLSADQGAQLHAQRVQQFGIEAAERLRAEDAAWADWRARLEAARKRLQALAAAPELSELQRRQAQQQDLAQNFSGQELVRAGALLGVDP